LVNYVAFSLDLGSLNGIAPFCFQELVKVSSLLSPRYSMLYDFLVLFGAVVATLLHYFGSSFYIDQSVESLHRTLHEKSRFLFVCFFCDVFAAFHDFLRYGLSNRSFDSSFNLLNHSVFCNHFMSLRLLEASIDVRKHKP
jgi:hypothetical protein